MNILLLGSGGREHALAWKIAQSPRLTRLFIAPGNAGTARVGTNLAISVNDFAAIRRVVTEYRIDMVIPGPEDPLVNGIHDFFLADPDLRHIPVIGPVKKAAMLEGSKDFAKDFMNRHNIPTARHRTFDRGSLSEGLSYLATLPPPYVLKADGLAAGKGVMICHSREEAAAELTGMLEGQRFGAASGKVVIEEFLSGTELSVFILTDGKNFILLPEAKDYKRIGDGDTGPNTGGMGSISPVPFAGPSFMDKVTTRIIRPTMEGLISEGTDYRGFIFFGLINVGGDPFVIEYNCRMGDPETESVVPRIRTDLVDLFSAVALQTLCNERIEVDTRFAATVMAVSGGYPGGYRTGLAVRGLDRVENSLVFHAGTSTEGDPVRVTTAGGRVLAVTSLADTMHSALQASYRELSKIEFDGICYRRDIGFDL